MFGPLIHELNKKPTDQFGSVRFRGLRVFIDSPTYNCAIQKQIARLFWWMKNSCRKTDKEEKKVKKGRLELSGGQ